MPPERGDWGGRRGGADQGLDEMDEGMRLATAESEPWAFAVCARSGKQAGTGGVGWDTSDWSRALWDLAR